MMFQECTLFKALGTEPACNQEFVCYVDIVDPCTDIVVEWSDDGPLAGHDITVDHATIADPDGLIIDMSEVVSWDVDIDYRDRFK